MGLENLPCPSLDNHNTKCFAFSCPHHCFLSPFAAAQPSRTLPWEPSIAGAGFCCYPHHSGFLSTELRDHAINLSLSTCTHAYTSVLFPPKLFLPLSLVVPNVTKLCGKSPITPEVGTVATATKPYPSGPVPRCQPISFSPVFLTVPWEQFSHAVLIISLFTCSAGWGSRLLPTLSQQVGHGRCE